MADDSSHSPSVDRIDDEQLATVYRRGDRLFMWLFLAQWVFAIAIALLWSPYGWAGKVRTAHLHVYFAVFFGAALTIPTIFMVRARPGTALNRHVIAVLQVMWSALLIHLTGGRIETHFHVFGSLAFLAFYRDWKVLISATAAVVVDHLLRGLYWPESVYGLTNPEWWRFVEHAFWVMFGEPSCSSSGSSRVGEGTHARLTSGSSRGAQSDGRREGRRAHPRAVRGQREAGQRDRRAPACRKPTAARPQARSSGQAGGGDRPRDQHPRAVRQRQRRIRSGDQRRPHRTAGRLPGSRRVVRGRTSCTDRCRPPTKNGGGPRASLRSRTPPQGTRQRDERARENGDNRSLDEDLRPSRRHGDVPGRYQSFHWQYRRDRETRVQLGGRRRDRLWTGRPGDLLRGRREPGGAEPAGQRCRRHCRTWSRTRARVARSTCGRGRRATSYRSPSAILERASRKTFAIASSTRSLRPRRLARVPVKGLPSCELSSTNMAGPSNWRTKSGRERHFSSDCRCGEILSEAR